jgi:hypothetical protein
MGGVFSARSYRDTSGIRRRCGRQWSDRPLRATRWCTRILPVGRRARRRGPEQPRGQRTPRGGAQACVPSGDRGAGDCTGRGGQGQPGPVTPTPPPRIGRYVVLSSTCHVGRLDRPGEGVRPTSSVRLYGRPCCRWKLRKEYWLPAARRVCGAVMPACAGVGDIRGTPGSVDHCDSSPRSRATPEVHSNAGHRMRPRETATARSPSGARSVGRKFFCGSCLSGPQWESVSFRIHPWACRCLRQSTCP